MLGYSGLGKVFTPEAVKVLRTIKYCALAIIGLVAVGEVFILLQTGEDRAGGVFMGPLITFGSVIVAAAAAALEQILQDAVDLKAGNDVKG